MSGRVINTGRPVPEAPPTLAQVERATRAAGRLVATGGQVCKDCGAPLVDDGTAGVRVYPQLTERLGYAEIICGTCYRLGLD